MPPQLLSPRLPGVKMLVPDATGPQYARWRRGVKSTFIAKGTWPHCDGTCPMPMPESGSTFLAPNSPTNAQPELLEERRAWVKKDRDVKMDIFLSVADDIKLEVFEVGPPLPPSSMTAKDMIEALDERFGEFKFEEFHHVFCHFLNLHIDQYPNLADFNTEFTNTLEDLLDHGYPLDNNQASSAYFSKLRCTQNPWVAKKLKEWDALPSPPLLGDLMKECPPWMIIRPLARKPTAQTSVPDLYSEDVMGPPSGKEDEGENSETEKSEATTSSSRSSAEHSRNPSNQSLKPANIQAQEVATLHVRSPSNQSLKPASVHTRTSSAQSQETTASHARNYSERSLEITVGASFEDLHNLLAFPMPAQKLLKAPSTRVKSSRSKQDLYKMSFPAPLNPPINRPLPPLPPGVARSRSNSPRPRAIKTNIKQSGPTLPMTAPMPEPLFMISPPLPQTPRTQNPQETHPALRNSASAPDLESTTPTRESPPRSNPETPQRRPSSSHDHSSPSKNLAPPLTPDLQQRPASSRGSPSKPFLIAQSTPETLSSWTLLNRPSPQLRRENSNNSSILSLPLQGVTVPEFRDTIMGGAGNNTSLSSGSMVVGLGVTIEHPETPALGGANGGQKFLSSSPPLSLMSRMSAELDDEKKNRKRSWSLKSKLTSRKPEVKEMI